MRVLLVTESYWPNPDGGAQFTRRLVQGLCSDGNSVSVWAPGRKLHSFKQKDKISIIYREKSIPFLLHLESRMSFFPFFRSRRIFEESKPDVIHIHFPTLMGLLSIGAARRRGIPIIATNHFMPENLLYNLGLKPRHFAYKTLDAICWQYIRWYYKKVDFLTSPTPTAINLLHKHNVKGPMRAISNGVDVASYSKATASKARIKYNIPSNRPVVLYFGRVDKEKNIDVIVRAAAEAMLNSDLHLVIAGRGNDESRLKKLAKKLNIYEKSTFTGYVPDLIKASLIKAGSVFVISSPSELQSIVSLEAMSCSKPIIAANSTALPELVDSGVNGYLFKPGNSHDLAVKISKLTSSQARMDKFGRASLLKVTSRHSNRATLDQFEEIYRLVIK